MTTPTCPRCGGRARGRYEVRDESGVVAWVVAQCDQHHAWLAEGHLEPGYMVDAAGRVVVDPEPAQH